MVAIIFNSTCQWFICNVNYDRDRVLHQFYAFYIVYVNQFHVNPVILLFNISAEL